MAVENSSVIRIYQTWIKITESLPLFPDYLALKTDFIDVSAISAIKIM